MKQSTALFALLFAAQIASAQITDAEMEARLVELAWKNNPLAHISASEVDIAKKEARVVGAEWSTLLGATGNLNEFNIQQFTSPDSAPTGNTFFPRYNVFVRIPFSLFVETPRKKKVALAKIDLADEKVQLTKLELKAKVLKLYSDYLKSRDTWIVRQEILGKEKTNFEIIERDYRDKKVSLEQYTTGSRFYNEQRILELQARNEFTKTKIGIEELIGMPMEDVSKP